MPPILAIVLQAPIMVVLMEVGYSSAVNMWTMSNAPEIDQVHIDEAQDGVDSEMDLVSTEGEQTTESLNPSATKIWIFRNFRKSE